MNQADISGHLLEDWAPFIPSSMSSAVMGWPAYLIEQMTVQSLNYLTLRQEVGHIERQWKGFLSWMLGVAGTRRFLKEEGYSWVAPVSAFYDNATYELDPSQWNPLFPASIVTVDLPSNPKSRLRPDYLAIRLKHGKIEWAVVESKGTARCLSNVNSCPRDWRNQARNLVVKVNGRRVKIPRHIVVATRSNPNAVFQKTRRLQIRAWNNADDISSGEFPTLAAIDIIASHLFGVFRNFGFRENALSLSFSVRARAESSTYNKITNSLRESLNQLQKRANSELYQMAFAKKGSDKDRMHVINTEFGEVQLELSDA